MKDSPVTRKKQLGYVSGNGWEEKNTCQTNESKLPAEYPDFHGQSTKGP